MICLKGVSLGYGRDVVVKNVDFMLSRGDFVALVGANGVGKSTLINTLVGILEPIAGKVSLEFQTKRKNPFNDIGFSPQDQIMDWYMNVYDNIIQGPVLAGFSRKEAAKNCKKVIELLDITKISSSSVDHISGGQQQRVQIARELAKDPQIYILDEPTTGLDVETSERLFSFLKKRSQQGALILVSSHDLTLLENYADKLIFLDSGEQKYFGYLNDFLNGETSLREKYLKERGKHHGSKKF
ncbi:ABC transporter ATP-binding protein [Ligilactobacillus animalis]|nr:ABC transporter ATP-binding protein [Ligilactobacillus animalis]